ncbi:MAG: right-handed parallel beta-helix repeat-containing protein [Natrialbaceae archaeon]|nr:right-handed parallel beta-helix repeat-containing protein [Natrialbaceae archaeon]
MDSDIKVDELHRHLVVVGLAVVLLAIVGTGLIGGTAAADPITTCGTINQSGVHTVQNDITNSSSKCFQLQADDVTLDLNGHTINGSESIYAAISPEGNNQTIMNGTITSFWYGIYDGTSTHSNLTLSSLDVTGNENGFSISQRQGVTIDSISVSDNADAGARITFSDSVTLTNNTFLNNDPDDGIFADLSIRRSSNVIVENFTAYQSPSSLNPGPGIRFLDLVDVSLSDAIVRGHSDNLLFENVSDFTLENVKSRNADLDSYQSTEITNISTESLQIGQHSTLTFTHDQSEVTVNHTPYMSNTPAGYYHRGRLAIDGLYPGQIIGMNATFQNPWFNVRDGCSLSEYQPRNGKLPTTNDGTIGDEIVNISTTFDGDGVYDIYGTNVVDSVSVTNVSVAVGGTQSLTAEARYVDGTNVTVTNFSSFFTSDTDIISINGTTVTGETVGTATVAAYYKEPNTGTTYNGTGTVTVSAAPDPVPESYYGTLEINGSPAEVGTVVEARIDGTTVGSITVDSPGVYAGTTAFDKQLLVNGTADDVGSPVSFHVIPNTSSLIPGAANQTSPFQPNNYTELNLTASLEAPLPPVYETTVPNDGGMAAVGLPGPVNGTIDDMFENISPVNTFYIHKNGNWQQVWDPNHQFEALEAFVLTTSGEGPATINVSIALEANTTASNRTLDSGWSLVSAPRFTDAEAAFGTDETLLVLDPFDRPTGDRFGTADAFDSYVVGSTDWGATSPSVSPFGAYFVYADSPTELPVMAQDFPYRQVLDDLLGISG